MFSSVNVTLYRYTDKDFDNRGNGPEAEYTGRIEVEDATYCVTILVQGPHLRAAAMIPRTLLVSVEGVK